MDWSNLSEVVVGLAIRKKLTPGSINPDTLAAPYNRMLNDLRDGADESDLVSSHGWSPYAAATAAAEAVKPELNWIGMLERAHLLADAGSRMSRLVKQMERGEDVDVGKMLAIVQSLDKEQTDFITLDKVEPAKQEELWVPTFYQPWDNHVGPNLSGVGGIVRGGLNIIGAPPGVGKTTLLLRFLINMAQHGHTVAFLSMEMTLAQVALRMLEIQKLPKKVRANIIASEDVCPVNEVYAKITRLVASHPSLYAVGIDFADLMVEGEQSEQVMGDIYKTLAVLAKRTGVPIVLLSQLSRRYEGGVPRVSHLRYSGMAEATASTVALLYNPDNLWVDMGAGKEKNPLPFVPGQAYIILGKSRYGFKHGGVGAFQVDWDGALGWGQKDYGWSPLGGA